MKDNTEERFAHTSTPLEWTPGLVSRFWNHHSLTPEQYFASQFGRPIARLMRRYLPQGASIIDYACGIGGLTAHMLDAGLSVTACDISEHSVQVVNKRFKGRKGFLGAWHVDELPTSGLKFDGAALVEFVEHVDDEILSRAFQCLRKVLVPGGVLMITCPHEEDLSSQTVYCPCCNHTYHRWQHVRSWSAEGLRRLFSDFRLDTIDCFASDFSLNPADGWLRYVIKKGLGKFGKIRQPHLVGVARVPLKDIFSAKTFG